MRKITVLDHPHQQFTVLLGGIRAELDLHYNALCDRWYMNVSVDDSCVGTFKIVNDSLLMSSCAPADFGDFIAAGDNLGRDGFNTGELCLYYLTPQEAGLAEMGGL